MHRTMNYSTLCLSFPRSCSWNNRVVFSLAHREPFSIITENTWCIKLLTLTFVVHFNTLFDICEHLRNASARCYLEYRSWDTAYRKNKEKLSEDICLLHHALWGCIYKHKVGLTGANALYTLLIWIHGNNCIETCFTDLQDFQTQTFTLELSILPTFQHIQLSTHGHDQSVQIIKKSLPSFFDLPWKKLYFTTNCTTYILYNIYY